MKTNYKLAVALVDGAAIGGAAVQGLHAQAKPPAYVVIPILKINDAAAFKAGVIDKGGASEGAVKAEGGHTSSAAKNSPVWMGIRRSA